LDVHAWVLKQIEKRDIVVKREVRIDDDGTRSGISRV
jgi:hypothetical protein